MNRLRAIYDNFYGKDGFAAEQGVEYPDYIRRLGATAIVPGVALTVAGIIGAALGSHNPDLLLTGMATTEVGATMYVTGAALDYPYVPTDSHAKTFDN
jgi:hypothetical protein